MNDLNAQQIVLLTLLVSFVTSIATGIVTVSLLEQAPEPVTQTINRVVEKTIEKVVTEPGEPQEKIIETVVVKEEDAIVDVVNSGAKSLVRIYDIIDKKKGNFIGLGVVIESNGKMIASDLNVIAGTSYIGVYNQGEFKLRTEPNDNAALIHLIPEDAGQTSFNPIAISGKDPQLGQSIILLSGRLSNKVLTGIITETNDITDQSGNSKVESFATSISADNILNGSYILNLKGEVIGISLDGANKFLASPSM